MQMFTAMTKTSLYTSELTCPLYHRMCSSMQMNIAMTKTSLYTSKPPALYASHMFVLQCKCLQPRRRPLFTQANNLPFMLHIICVLQCKCLQPRLRPLFTQVNHLPFIPQNMCVVFSMQMNKAMTNTFFFFTCDLPALYAPPSRMLCRSWAPGGELFASLLSSPSAPESQHTARLSVSPLSV